MDWKAPAILSLLFLAAAAGPPSNCMPSADSGQTLPTPLDLAGQPDIPAGLAGRTFATLPGAAGCDSAPPSAWQSTTFRNESDDVLHGLPAPDTLRPIDEPKRAPQFE